MHQLAILAAGALSSAAAASGSSLQGSRAQGVRMEANPSRVCASSGDLSYPNVDFLISNPTSTELKINELRGTVLDASGRVTERRLIWQQSLSLLGTDRVVPASGKAMIFNPLLFRTATVGTRIRFEVDFSGQSPASAPLSVTVTPENCTNAIRLVSPIGGRVLIYDGYDLYSHHRRSRYSGELKDNFQRFGIDLVVVDEQGKLFKDAGARADQWHGWGRPVRAPAAGVVVAVHDGQADNVAMGTLDRWVDRDMNKNPMTSYGNYVLIDHGGGEFTVAGHLRNGSIKVKKGDRVSPRQAIGSIGNSGASGGVHVHFERRTGPGITGMMTLPASFHDVAIVGRRHNLDGPVAVDTGDILVAR
jgi:hypothetical protein